MEKKNKVKCIVLAIVFIVIFVIIVTIVLVYKNNILNQIYNENETTQRVAVSKLSDEEKELYNKAVSRNDNSLLTGKTVKDIIEEERTRQTEEQRQIDEQKAKEEEMKKVEEDSSGTLLEELDRYMTAYMEGIDTATYTYEVSDINFEKLRMYYDSIVKAVNTFKEEISKYDELKEKNADNFAKLDEYIKTFDNATQKKNNMDEVFDSFEEMTDKYEVCYEMIFKNVSNGKIVYEYLN